MINKILVAVDGSETSDRALIFAGEVASNAQAELVILTVIPPISPLAFPRMGLGQGQGGGLRPGVANRVSEYEESTREAHEEVLEKAGETIEKAYPELKIIKKMGKGHIASLIMSTARSEEVDLIVMGRHGYSGIKGWLLGSTSKQVTEECNKPILIVK